MLSFKEENASLKAKQKKKKKTNKSESQESKTETLGSIRYCVFDMMPHEIHMLFLAKNAEQEFIKPLNKTSTLWET